MEKRLPRISVVFIVALLLIPATKTEAQLKPTVSIQTLRLGVVFQGAPEPVAEHSSFRGIYRS